jgi:hypothetical protein
MSTKPARINDATSKAGIAKGDMKLEVLIIPVSDAARRSTVRVRRRQNPKSTCTDIG